MTEQQNLKEKKKLSDEAVDAIAAVVLIAVVVTGILFWLSGLSAS